MGKTSSEVKNRWNKTHYTQVKVCVNPEIASAFKSKCEKNKVSMASELSDFMSERSGFGKAVNKAKKDALTTKGGRRAMVDSIILQLEQIKDAESEYRDNMPENLKGSIRYEAADKAVSDLDEAIDMLSEAF